MKLEQLATQVAQRRQAVAELKAEWDALQAAFAEQHAGMIESLAATKAALAKEEDELRAAGFAEFQSTGAKKLPHGMGIRITTKPDYDPAQALTWAKYHGLALQLDKAAFERIVKADTPDFVKMIDVVTVTLPTDTAKLLGDA